MPVIKTMSDHFVYRWEQRVGSVPTLEEVNRIIASGKKIRKQRESFERSGKRHVILAEYWNHPAGVILRVDEDSGRAITVITADCPGIA